MLIEDVERAQEQAQAKAKYESEEAQFALLHQGHYRGGRRQRSATTASGE